MDKKQQTQAIMDKLTGVSDMDWAELAEISGLGIHPDQQRKMGAGIRLVSEAGMLAPDGQNCEDADTNPTELQKLRDLRREINESARADARSEALRETVALCAARMEPIRVIQDIDDTESGDRTLVVCIADCHYGAQWRITGLRDEVINEYSPEIFERRMAGLLSQVLRIAGKERITDIVLLLCGDSLDGMLRQSQLMKLRYGLVESCMRFAEYMAQWIAALAKQAFVSVYSVDGNHTELRPLGSKRGEFENENLEKIIVWFLDERFRNVSGVHIDLPAKPMKFFNVQGFSFLLSHDTSTRAMENAAKQAMLQYGEKVDYMICGHRHREQEFVSGYTDAGNSMVIRVPSVCGADRFAQQLGYGGKPGALCMVMEKGYGRRCVYPITF